MRFFPSPLRGGVGVGVATYAHANRTSNVMEAATPQTDYGAGGRPFEDVAS